MERQGEPDWEGVLERAIANLEQATGRSFREKPEEAPPEETMPDPLTQVPESPEMPFMDGVNHLLSSLDQYFGQILREALNPTLIKSHPNYENLRLYGIIAP